MTAALFLGLVLLAATGVAAAGVRWGQGRIGPVLSAVLLIWLGYVGLLGTTGALSDPTLRPPGILLLAVPLGLLVAWLAWSSTGLRTALAVPVSVLIGAQIFRVAVELLLHRLWQEGMVPRMLTYEGANFDILVGLSAPLAAWAATRGRAGTTAALVWNLAGLALLGNVVVRAVLTAPGRLHMLATEVPNRLPGNFPFVYLAGFLAPLALVLHLLALRALRRRVPSAASGYTTRRDDAGAPREPTDVAPQDTAARPAASDPTRRGLEHRVPPPVVFVLVGAAMSAVAARLPPSGLAGPPTLGAGIGLLILAGVTGPAAIRRFARAGTTIDPVAIDRASVLVTDGIYRWSRNPMYLAMTAILGALCAWTAQPWLALGPVAFVLFITRFQILPEERAMRARFGAAYDAYRTRVRRWI